VFYLLTQPNRYFVLTLLILNPTHAFVEYVVVLGEQKHREIVDGVGDEKSREYINRVVKVAKQDHRAEDNGYHEEYMP